MQPTTYDHCNCSVCASTRVESRQALGVLRVRSTGTTFFHTPRTYVSYRMRHAAATLSPVLSRGSSVEDSSSVCLGSPCVAGGATESSFHPSDAFVRVERVEEPCRVGTFSERTWVDNTVDNINSTASPMASHVDKDMVTTSCCCFRNLFKGKRKRSHTV